MPRGFLINHVRSRRFSNEVYGYDQRHIKRGKLFNDARCKAPSRTIHLVPLDRTFPFVCGVSVILIEYEATSKILQNCNRSV